VTAVRILPLGGLGEIGKNMTVVEYGDEIVVVDTGLMFPTSEMLGIDLVLPDFSYLRGRADDIQAIVLTHGHEDHVGALPFVLREIFQSDATLMPPIYGGALTIGLVRSKLAKALWLLWPLWVGFAVSARLPWLAPVFVAILAFEYHAIVRWEERLLEERLGESYRTYTGQVPRWVPNPSSRRARSTVNVFSWRETFYSERGTLIAIAIGFAALWLKAHGLWLRPA